MAKKCTGCGEVKCLSAFPINRAGKDGYHTKCKECRKAIHKAHRDANKEARNAYNREYNKRNRVRLNGYDAKYRDSGKKIRFTRISDNSWTVMLSFYGAACLSCGSTESLEFDHVVPKVKGGEHSLRNGQVLCKSCNSRKRDRNSKDYRPIDRGILAGAYGLEPMVMHRGKTLRMTIDELLPEVCAILPSSQQ